MKTKTTAERRQLIEHHGWRVITAIHQITQAKRTRNADYDERIRALRGFMDVLRVTETDQQQLDLFKPEELLPPTIAALVENPLRGLS